MTLIDRLKAATGPAKRVEKFAHVWRKIMTNGSNRDGTIYSLQIGSPDECELQLDDLDALVSLFAALEAKEPTHADK